MKQCCKQGKERLQLVVAELDHRVKNVLATVSAVAAHTLEREQLDGPLRGRARRSSVGRWRQRMSY